MLLTIFTAKGGYQWVSQPSGDRRLVIFPDHLELIGMLEPLPPASTRFYDIFSAPYIPLTSGGDDVRASESGSFTVNNAMWVARYHSAFAGFGRRVSLPSGGAPIQIQALWDLSPFMKANGLGYASAQLILRLEVHPENMSLGLLEAPFVREQLYRRSRLVFGFVQPAGRFVGETPVISLNLTQRTPLMSFYRKKKREKGAGKAICATARKLLTIIFLLPKKELDYWYLEDRLYNRKLRALDAAA